MKHKYWLIHWIQWRKIRLESKLFDPVIFCLVTQNLTNQPIGTNIQRIFKLTLVHATFKKIGGYQSFSWDHWYLCPGFQSQGGRLHASLPVCNGFLRRTTGVTPADLFTGSSCTTDFWQILYQKYLKCKPGKSYHEQRDNLFQDELYQYLEPPWTDVTRSPKQGCNWPHKKDWRLPILFMK